MQFPLVKQAISLDGNEIALLMPDENAVKAAYQKGEIPFPFWSQVWPAAKALAQFVVDHSEYISGKNVLEMGAGLGLPSLIAARFATSVLCTDHALEVVAIAEQSARLHCLQNFTALVLDWNDLPADLTADVLLLSDINYEPAAFNTLQKLIHRFIQSGTTIILATPQRLMAKEFIASLLPYCIAQEQLAVTHKQQQVPISIFVLKN